MPQPIPTGATCLVYPDEMLKPPGPNDPALSGILEEINTAQKSLDAAIAEAKRLPDIEPSKALRIRRLNAMKREVNRTFDSLERSTTLWANDEIGRAYTQGFFSSAIQMDVGYDFSLPHREAINVLVNDTFTDVGNGLKQARQSFIDKINTQNATERLSTSQKVLIRTKGKSLVTQQLLTGLTDVGDTAKLLRDELWAEGITIIDRSGRKWGMESYTRMLVRTKSAMAYNAGSLGKYKDEGVDRVLVFDGVDDDSICSAANGEVWSIKYAEKHVIAHPNCRRAFGPAHGHKVINKVDASEVQKVLGPAATQILRAVEAAQFIGVVRSYALNPGVVQLQTGLTLTALEKLEFRAFKSSRIHDIIEAMERQLETVIDPAMERLGVITPEQVPAHVRQDWAIIKVRLAHAGVEARQNLDDIKWLKPAPDHIEPPPVNFGTLDDPHYQTLINKLEKGISDADTGVSGPVNIPLEEHQEIARLFRETQRPEEAKLIAIALRHPDDAARTFLDFLQENSIDTVSGINFMGVWMDAIVTLEGSVGSNTAVLGLDLVLGVRIGKVPLQVLVAQDLASVLSTPDWTDIASGVMTIRWSKSKLPSLGWDKITMADPAFLIGTIDTGWVQILRRDELVWGSAGNLFRKERKSLLENIFGVGNVRAVNTNNINGTVYIIEESIVIKYVSGHGGGAPAIIGESISARMHKELGWPTATVKFFSVDDNIYQISVFVPGDIATFANVRKTSIDENRRGALNDIFMMWLDGHKDNTQVHNLSALIPIDREHVFASGSTLRAWTHTQAGREFRSRVEDALRLGQDMDHRPPFILGDYPSNITFTGEIRPYVDKYSGKMLHGNIVRMEVGSSRRTDSVLVHYLTKRESDYMDLLLAGDLDDEFLFSVIVNASKVDPDLLDIAISASDIKSTVLRLRGAMEELMNRGVLVDYGVGYEWSHFGGVGASLGKEFRAVVDGKEVTGVVNHMWRRFDDNVRQISLFDDATGISTTIAETDIVGRAPSLFDDGLVDEYFNVRRIVPDSPPFEQVGGAVPATFIDVDGLVYLPDYDDFGVMKGTIKSKIDVNLSGVRDSNVRGNFYSKAQLESAINIVLDDALLHVNPLNRPRNIEVLHDVIDAGAQHGKAHGMYDPVTDTVYLSVESLLDVRDAARANELLSPLLNFEKFDGVVQHEFGHGIYNRSLQRSADRIRVKLLKDLMDSEFNTDGTWGGIRKALQEEFDFPTHRPVDLAIPAAKSEVVNGEILDVIDPVREYLDRQVRAAMLIVESENRRNVARMIKELKKADEVSPELRYAIAAMDEEHSDGPAEFFADLWANRLDLSEMMVMDDRVFRDSLTRSLLVDAWEYGDLEFPDLTKLWTKRSFPRKLLKKIDDDEIVESLLEQIFDVSPDVGGGGFTFDTSLGKFLDDGWAVAIEDNQRVIANVVDSNSLDPAEVRRFLKDNKETLKQRKWAFGGWWHRDETTMYFDTSKVVDDHSAAAVFGFDNKQISMFHLKTFRTRYLIKQGADTPGFKNFKEYTEAVDAHLNALAGKNAKGVNTIGFVEKGGDHLEMRLASLTPEGRKVLLEKLKTRITDLETGEAVSVTVEGIQENYMKVLRRAAGEVRAGRYQREFFYREWHVALRDVATETGNEFNAVVAAVAVASPGLEATSNLDIVIQAVKHLNTKVTASDLKVFREEILGSFDYLKIKPSKDWTRADFRKAESLKAMLAVKPGTTLKDLPPEVFLHIFRAVHLNRLGYRLQASKRGWEHIIKGYSILLGDQTIEAIESTMKGSKVRSFYNNIRDPFNSLGYNDLTIDFHMSNAALFTDSFGTSANEAMITVKGVELGLRPVAGEAVFNILKIAREEPNGEIAEMFRILQISPDRPLEFQEVIWLIWKLGLLEENKWWGDLISVKT